MPCYLFLYYKISFMRSVDRRLMINRTTICYLLDSEYFNQSELRWVNYESSNCIAFTRNNRNSSWCLPFLYISTSIGILVSMSAYSMSTLHGYYIIDQQITRHFVHYSECLSYSWFKDLRQSWLRIGILANPEILKALMFALKILSS